MSPSHSLEPEAAEQSSAPSLRQLSGWILGPGALILTLVLPPPPGLSPEGWRTAGAALLMAIFWICESVPIPVTALLPLILFPALGLGTFGRRPRPLRTR